MENLHMKKMREEISSLSFWMRGFSGWWRRNRKAFEEYKYSTMSFTEEEKQKFNQALDLVNQAREILRELFSKRLAKEVWDCIYWG